MTQETDLVTRATLTDEERDTLEGQARYNQDDWLIPYAARDKALRAVVEMLRDLSADPEHRTFEAWNRLIEVLDAAFIPLPEGV